MRAHCQGSEAVGRLCGPRDVSRDCRLEERNPPCQSSTPASAPCACTASAITAMLRASPSSHRLAKGAGMSSDVGWMEQYSVFTTPQPPSALMPRIAASVAGRP